MRPMRLFRSQSVAEQKQEDRVWRERFVQNAVANVRLEGLEPSPKALEIWQRYIEGEISVEQAGELIRALPTGF
jgi:Antitoxin VbhA